MDEQRKDERRQPLSDAEKVQLGTVLPHEQRETDRRAEQSCDRDTPLTNNDERETE